MRIVGYSERGAMNALFYGMALDCKNGNDAMKEFLKMASFNEEEINKFADFNLFMEFSLSEFGDPDLVIVAKDKNGKGTVFFVEAKVSNGNKYKLLDQKAKHNEYIEESKDPLKKYDASNLFFQLRLKHIFFETKGGEYEYSYDNKIRNKKGKFEDSNDNLRGIGKNQIVIKFKEEIFNKYKCEKAYYIAIIPQHPEIMPKFRELFKFDIHFVTWEAIKVNPQMQKYINETLDFNQNNEYSQILNNPVE